jgi:hypothetical protein
MASADPWQLFDIVSHLPAIFLLWFFLKDPRRFPIEIAATVQMLVASLMLHMCYLTGQDECLLALDDHVRYDHASANYFLLVMVVRAVPVLESLLDAEWMRTLFLVSMAVVHINYYLLVAYDLYIWVAYGAIAVFIAGCVFYMYRRDPKEYFKGYNAGLGLLGLAFVGGAFACYWLETDSNRHITHSLWHLFGFVAIILLLQANRVRIFGEHAQKTLETFTKRISNAATGQWTVRFFI